MKFNEQIINAEGRVNPNEFSYDSDQWKKFESMERILFRLKRLELDDVIAESMQADSDSQPNILERIIKANEFMKVSFLYKGASVAKTVGRVVIKHSTGRTVGHGTGFMVSPRLLLTNNHVLENKREAKNSLIEFNYRENYAGDRTNSIRFKLRPDKFFFTDDALDFSLVAVEKQNRRGDLVKEQGWNQLIRTSGKAIVGEHVNIIQHPAAEPKQIAIRQNTIKAIKSSFIHYITDTKRGSSGSPVYNDQWEVVALHHAGVPERKNGKIMQTNGLPWNGTRATMGQIAWVANEGVRISKILKHLDQLRMSRSEKKLYREMFDLSPDHTESTPSESTQKDALQQGPIEEPDGSSSWYFRLNFGPVANKKLIAGDIVHTSDDTSEDPEEPDNSDQPDFTDAASAIVNKASAESQAYYNAKEDQKNREKYYSNINFDHPPKKLFKALSKHLDVTHKNRYSYKKARWDYLYPIVDRREAGHLRNIYSGTIIDPVEVIRQEMLLIEGHREEFSKRLEAEQLKPDFDPEETIDFLESQLQFNCEHVVPQSWFHEKQPMRADLHHLFACEPKCNGFRDSIPYFQFDPIDEATHDQCGRKESNKFEPEAGHGAVARATLYFLLRYPGEIGNKSREMQKSRLQTLINWHNSYPVDRYELHRNEAIFSAQGNRNPLIDFPELVDKIDFELGFGS